MKIRDLLVIIFTAIVALLLLGRSAHADGACPTPGVGGDCQGSTSGSGGDPGWDFRALLVDWRCADTCASICRNRCVVACEDSKDPQCVAACYPVCAEECYDECSGPRAARGPVEYGASPGLVLRDADAGAPLP